MTAPSVSVDSDYRGPRRFPAAVRLRKRRDEIGDAVTSRRAITGLTG